MDGRARVVNRLKMKSFSWTEILAPEIASIPQANPPTGA